LLLADGRVKHVHAIAHATRDKAGRLEYVGAAQDVTRHRLAEAQRKEAEEALQASERDLRSIIRTIPTMVWSAAPDGSVDFFNPRWLDYTGLSPDQSLDWRWSAAIHPDDLSRLTDAWQSILVSGESAETEARLRHFDGAYRWFLFRANPLRDESGNIVKWYGINLDIEDRKRAEEALRRSESYLSEAQRLSQTGSWAWSPDQGIRYWSEECYRVLSFDPQDGLPRFEDFFQRIHPDDQPGFMELIQTAIREKAEWEADYRIVYPDGPIRDIHVLGHPVLSTSGHLVEFVGTVIDVTERRRAEQERVRRRQLEADLAHINRVSTLGEMAASLAHEVKQPIATARNNARAALNFLDRSPPDLREVREAVDCIVGDADRAADIVERIRDHIKKAPLRKDRFDLNEAIKEVVVLARGAITKNDVSVVTRLAEGSFPVQGDRVQLQQVVLNLILNAVDAMSSVEAGPRELVISAEQNQTNDVLIAVRDTGPGIDREHLDRIFEAFYTTKSSGLGMGLSICRSIVEAHGGRLWATRCEPRGALFQFTVPAN
jgi:PAS domain S-box-containing protein